MLFPPFIAAALVATCSATKLYVSSYNGNITTLDLTNTNGAYHLAQIQSTDQCQQNASWLTFDATRHHLYCLDEGIVASNGSLNSFKVDHESGALTKLKNQMTLAAPVNSIIYEGKNGAQLLAVAHYAFALTTWSLDPTTGSFASLQTFDWTLDKPGPNADRQKTPHPHQVLTDPTNTYFVIPDLGADQVRILSIDPKSLKLTQRPSISVAPGSGPRHGRFHVTENKETFYYLVTEMGNTLTGYKVTYLPQDGGLDLIPIANSATYGPTTNPSFFAGNAAAEIGIAKNGKSIIVSNRNATYWNIPNPNPNGAMIGSDTMATFPLASSGDGTFTFGELSPAGGSFPRQFSQSDDGDLVAVGLQLSGRVVVYSVCKDTGKLGMTELAAFEGLGNVTSVLWGK